MHEPFNDETLLHLTKLSRIRCTAEEAAHLATSIAKIVGHIEKLQEIDTEGVDPCYSVITHKDNVFRNDEVDNSLPRGDFLANAPEHIGGMIRVPKVLA